MQRIAWRSGSVVPAKFKHRISYVAFVCAHSSRSQRGMGARKTVCCVLFAETSLSLAIQMLQCTRMPSSCSRPAILLILHHPVVAGSACKLLHA